MTKLRPYVVRWHDACDALPTWTKAEELELLGPVEVTSVGYLVHHDNGDITLVTSITDADDHGGGVTIPAGCVIDIIELDTLAWDIDGTR
jgi:hypothetical protein